MAEPQPSSSNSTAASRMTERMQKLKSLHAKRTESRQINHAEVIEEDRRAKEPKNMEARKRRAEYLLQEEEFKRKCEAEGKDFEREKMRRKGADEVSGVQLMKCLSGVSDYINQIIYSVIVN